MKKNYSVVIFGSLLGCAVAGFFGAYFYRQYFFHPESFCYCSQIQAKSDTVIPELVRLKKFLGIKEDIQMYAVYEKVKDDLVGIYKKKEAAQNSIEGVYSESDYLGGGFILTSDGWIVTSADFPRTIKKEALAVVYGLETYGVQSMVSDMYSGTTFMKIDAHNLPPAKLGSNGENNIGQNVLAISAIAGAIPTNIQYMNWRPSQDPSQFIESTEKLSEFTLIKDDINKFFDGGVIVSWDGEIVGVLQSQKDSKSISMAVSIDALRQSIDSILKNGKTERPFFGIRYVDLSRSAGLKNQRIPNMEKGIVVWDPPRGTTPAGMAGLRQWDVITQIDGSDISKKKSFGSIIQEYSVGSKVTLTVIRDGKEIKIDIKLGLLQQ